MQAAVLGCNPKPKKEENMQPTDVSVRLEVTSTTSTAPVHISYQGYVGQGTPERRGTSGRKGGASSRTIVLIECEVSLNHSGGVTKGLNVFLTMRVKAIDYQCLNGTVVQ